jgi:hypothetical protein
MAVPQTNVVLKEAGGRAMKAFPGLALAVLFAFIVLGLVMSTTGSRFQPVKGADLHGLKLKQLGIAVELSRGRQDFVQMVGPRDQDPYSAGSRNRSLLRWQQFLDFLFIALYLALFWILGGVEISAGFGGSLFLGIAVRAAIVLAAVFDVLEDRAILRAVGDDSYAQPIRNFGVPKWVFFFLALILVSVLFLYLCLRSHDAGSLDRALAGLIGLLLAAGGLLGLAGLIRDRDVYIAWASSCGVAPATVALLILMILVRKGT